MGLQARLDEQAIRLIPEIYDTISRAESFEANQMRCCVLREFLTSPKPVGEMNEDETSAFTDQIIAIFKYNDWI